MEYFRWSNLPHEVLIVVYGDGMDCKLCEWCNEHCTGLFAMNTLLRRLEDDNSYERVVVAAFDTEADAILFRLTYG